jgi:predicted acyltransferase
MKIPGLTFIVVPILLFIAYINMDVFINIYKNIEKDPWDFAARVTLIYTLLFFVELMFFQWNAESFSEWFNRSILSTPIRVTYKILKYINTKLTVTI